MPKMDGLEFIQHLRGEENRTMAWTLTARDAIENRVEGLESGADDYLVKPFAPAELVARAVRPAAAGRNQSREPVFLTYSEFPCGSGGARCRPGSTNLVLTVAPSSNLLHLFRATPARCWNAARFSMRPRVLTIRG